MRLIVLDTETTGLEPSQGHKIIEIGGVEVVDRKLTGKHFHKYINPQRDIDDGAFEVHGISSEFLADKPTFAEIAEEFVDFVKGAELVIHNASFDVSFLNYELSLLEQTPGTIEEHCQVTDSLALARHKHPGQKNSLDALCRRYAVDNSARQLHGALLDAEILADVYLLMTGGQTALFATDQDSVVVSGVNQPSPTRIPSDRPALKVIIPSAEEIAAHDAMIAFLDQQNSQGSLWRRLENNSEASL
ncbi:MAG: DNA polymerase III subunit epsilon [Gammaproteobacteria bacterium]|nr:MAG: DNA polymerase III subunit epsilon [Gammaproteobacteria bacterium]TDJ34658.1 MAG: DNA polymerase III subunit epsilon [Gammaproteobacteria bacterium]